MIKNRVFLLALTMTAMFSCVDFESIEHNLGDIKTTIAYQSDSPNLEVVLHKATLDYDQEGVFAANGMFGDSVLVKIDMTLQNMSSEDLNITKQFGIYDLDNNTTYYVPEDMPIVAKDNINRQGDTNGTLEGYAKRSGSSYLVVSERKQNRFILDTFELVIDKKRIPLK